MAKEKAIRPDSQRTKTLLETASRIDTRLREAMDSEPVQRRAAQDAAQALFDQRMRSALEEMDIEHINRAKQGIRVSLLRDAGIQNVYQASRLSFSEICAIDGLGEQSAWKILDTVKQITQNTRDTLQIRIQAENPGQTDDALIRSLYVLIHFRPLRQACALAYRANHAPLQQELQLARQSLSGFGWLFKSAGKKEQILAAVERLSARLDGPFGDGALLESLTLERILMDDPDYIFITTMGESYEKAMEALRESLTGNPAWASLTAVKEGRVIELPKALFQYKPNARWAQAYDLLWSLLYAP